jgi:hypothetical protein
MLLHWVRRITIKRCSSNPFPEFFLMTHKVKEWRNEMEMVNKYRDSVEKARNFL